MGKVLLKHMLAWIEEFDEDGDKALIGKCLAGNRDAILSEVPDTADDPRIVNCHSESYGRPS